MAKIKPKKLNGPYHIDDIAGPVMCNMQEWERHPKYQGGAIHIPTQTQFEVRPAPGVDLSPNSMLGIQDFVAYLRHQCPGTARPTAERLTQLGRAAIMLVLEWNFPGRVIEEK